MLANGSEQIEASNALNANICGKHSHSEMN
jgi:hypothetical protein